MNEKNGIGESKPKQSRRWGEPALELPVRRAYAVELLAVGKVLIWLTLNWICQIFTQKLLICYFYLFLLLFFITRSRTKDISEEKRREIAKAIFEWKF